MSKSNSGFSPTLHLINVLSTTLQGSVPEIAKCSGVNNACPCGKVRKNTIHLCVDVKDESITLATCNSKEGRARTIIIHPYQGRNAQGVAEKVLQVLKKSSLNTEIEIGVSGECNKFLQMASNAHTTQTPMPIDKVNIIPKCARRYEEMPNQKTKVDILDEENCKIFSKRFPEPIDWKDQPEVEEIYRNLLMIQSSERITLEMDGTFILKEPIKLLSDVGREKNKEDFWWKDGWTKLCQIVPNIVERLPNNKGMRVHCVQIASNCLATMLNETNDLLEKTQNAPSGKEEESMANVKYAKLPVGVKLTPKEREMILEILKLATDKSSDRATLPSYTNALVKSDYSGASAGSISVTASSLRRKKVAFKTNNAGEIQVLRLKFDDTNTSSPEGKTPGLVAAKKKVTKKTTPSESQTADTPNSKLTKDTPATKDNSAINLKETARQEELEGCSEKGAQEDLSREESIGRSQIAPDPSTSRQLLNLLAQVKNPKQLAEELALEKSDDSLLAIYRLKQILEAIESRSDCPQFGKEENGEMNVTRKIRIKV